jgi:hypothetical protein
LPGRTDFGSISLTKETCFVLTCWGREDARQGKFSLSGKSEDGIEFKTDDLLFKSPGHGSNKEIGSYMRPIGGCSQSKFCRKLAAATSKPFIRMYLKGFQNFGQLRSKCHLGVIAMDGNKFIVNHDTITGNIAVQSDDEPTDLLKWRTEAEKLLEHVRRVMSFASATVLHAPITEFFAGEDLEVITMSQTRQSPASMSVFHYLNQQPVFDAAVKSFFNPPYEIKNLFFAIEWFAMDATYNEVRLVNAMTALENLITSNLSVNDGLIRLRGEFKKTKRVLKKVIGECLSKWSTDEAEEVLKELDDKLSDLNRRSLLQKLYILAERWSVPLDGISDDKIRAAKKARDFIVHRGHYYEDGKVSSDNLWEHVTVVREIAVRFLLSAIGYQGSYLSYLGGSHDAWFPPKVDLLRDAQG